MKTKNTQSKKLVVANWKTNPISIAEAKKLFLDTKKKASTLRNVQTVVCPPTPFLSEIRKLYIGHRIALGAQDVFWEKKGSYTGEVSPDMLKSVGAEYVIIGHSERRERGESNEDVNKKIHAALKAGFTTIVCIGERDRDRSGDYLSFLKEQINSAFEGVSRSALSHVVIAYEPIWAIGKTDEDAMKPHDLHETVLYIRKIISERYDKKTALAVSVIYGGSVEPNNARSLIEEGMVRGFLVGHASLVPADFSVILEAANSSI